MSRENALYSFVSAEKAEFWKAREMAEDELESFRKEWKLDLATKQAPNPPVLNPNRRIERRIETTSTLEESLAGLSVEREKEPATALEYYASAVASEAEGRLNDALSNYRSAFRLDPEIDKTYHRYTLQQKSNPLPADSTTAPVAFKFERTIQLYPDYLEGENGEQSDSTNGFRETLLRSFGETPYVRPLEGEEGEVAEEEEKKLVEKLSVAEVHAQLSFIADDITLPNLLSSLPHEILLLILRATVLSSNLPPPAARYVEPVIPLTNTTAKKGKGKSKFHRTIEDEMRSFEQELELLEIGSNEWEVDIESFERFARICRHARIATLEESLWRAIVERIYRIPAQLGLEASGLVGRDVVGEMVRKTCRNDWRKFFLEKERIRFDGCFISVVTYLRRGESAESWTTPTHLITFYRYLRFYPSGLVLSLLTTDAPSEIVRHLNPTLRVKGLNIGRWCLYGDEVECSDLEDPSLAIGAKKYAFRMRLKLKSTNRGRMNKLDLLSLATERRSTLEIEDVPIRPTKPFYFSKVAIYAAEH